MKPLCYLTMFNLLTWPRAMAKECERLGFEVVLYDNASTYPPLLDWYQICPYRIIKSEGNGGCYGFFTNGLHKEQERPYALSDSDLDLSRVPDDALAQLTATLEANTNYPKAGLSLEYTDLPDTYPYKQNVVEHEPRFWVETLPDGNCFAQTGSTLCLYRPDRNDILEGNFYDSVRLRRPYTARHLPWYQSVESLTDEDRFYYENSTGPSFWNAAMRHFLKTVEKK